MAAKVGDAVELKLVGVRMGIVEIDGVDRILLALVDKDTEDQMALAMSAERAEKLAYSILEEVGNLKRAAGTIN